MKKIGEKEEERIIRDKNQSEMTVNYYEEEILLNENGVSTMVEIKNQGYPDSLKSNSVAKYAIYATPGGRIKVSFNSFNLPKHDGCSNLWLTVSEDPNLSEKASQAKWCGNNNPHYVISRSNRIFVYVFAKSNLSNSSKNFILKLEESSESSNLDAVFEGNRAYFEKEGVALSADLIFVDENPTTNYQPGGSTPQNPSSFGSSTLFSFPGFGPAIPPRNTAPSQVFIQDGGQIQVPSLSSNQNDLERPVMNSARPVFSDSMFIIPEQNFTRGDFNLLPPRTSAKMRRQALFASLGGLMIAIFMMSFIIWRCARTTCKPKEKEADLPRKHRARNRK